MKKFIIFTFTLCLSLFIFTSCSNNSGKSEEIKEYSALSDEVKEPVKNEISPKEENRQEEAVKKINIDKIYYYNPVDDIIVYKNVNVSKKEKAEIRFFEESFKNSPGDKVSVNMPKTTVINSIKVDEDNSMVTMDVSENFTANMNIGSGVESSILQSIANTLCETYKVERLLITTNGGEYQGSHVEVNSMNTIAKNTAGAKPVE